MLELPVHTKYLLIAAYLASYNPASSDKRFFAKVCCDLIHCCDVYFLLLSTCDNLGSNHYFTKKSFLMLGPHTVVFLRVN